MPNSQTTTKKLSPTAKALIMVLVATVFIIIFLLLAFLLAPEDPYPEFVMMDNENGEWTASGTVAVFEDKLKPGSKGEYDFAVVNTTDAKLVYAFDLHESFSVGSENIAPFMQYRLKMNNQYMGEAGETWLYGYELTYYDFILPENSTQLMTLEWRWPEEGNDANDTLVGRTGGQLWVTFHASAEVLDE